MNFAYHRLARSWPRYRWFKPFLTALIALAIYAVLAVVATIGFFVVSLLDPEGAGPAFERLVYEGFIDNSHPFILAFSLVTVALMLPALLLATLIMGPRPLGLLSSVVGRLRWGWMLRLALPALLAFGASYVVYLLIVPPIAGEPLAAPEVGASTWAILAVTLLLVPLQATAEEYVFRGYLMQTIGGWLKHPAWAVLLPVPLFMAGHLYDVWGLLDVGVFALFAGWITWRTGGLEAAIVAHVINNASIFALGAFGLVDVNAAEGSPWGVLVTALTLGLYAWLVLRMSGGVHRERRLVPPAQTGPTEQTGPTAPDPSVQALEARAPDAPQPMQGNAQDD